jgi:GT2 family glycosyltransferase
MYNSLCDNNLDWEMIMVGPYVGSAPGPRFKHIYATVKPAQCYEIAFRNASGELITWTADDSVYSSRAVDTMYRFFKSFNTNKLVTAFRTVEDGRDITEVHRFRGKDMSSPRMAPFGVVDRKLFNELGGYDKRFLCGQSENDVVMRILEIGGSVELCNEAKAIASHLEAHRDGTKFRTDNYHIDRKALEEAWVLDRVIQTKRLSSVQSYENENITTITQGENGGGQW